MSGFDRITDFTIGADRIDAPKAIVLGQVVQQGVVSQLNATKIAAVLTASTFTANGAATFTIGNGRRQQTFLALNNGIAGFSVKTDAIINITGYIGNLADLTIG